MNSLPGSLPKSLALALMLMLMLILCSISTSQVYGQTAEDLQERFDEIQKEYSRQQADLLKDDDETGLRELLVATNERVIELVDESDDPQQAVGMLNWMVNQNQPYPYSDEAIEKRLDRYLDQPGMADLLFERTPLRILESAREKSQNTIVQAVADYLIALKTKDEETREKILMDLKENHGDVLYRRTPLSKWVAEPLAKLRLRVGKVAPDIIGPDTDEVEFKLSDYRGKIVVLDFWGNW